MTKFEIACQRNAKLASFIGQYVAHAKDLTVEDMEKFYSDSSLIGYPISGDDMAKHKDCEKPFCAV